MRKILSIAGWAVVILYTCMLTIGFAQKVPPTPASQPIPDQYIVVLKESAARPVIKQQRQSNNRQQKAQLNLAARNSNIAKVKQVHGKSGIQGAAVRHIFADAIVGFSGKFSRAEVDALRRDPDVQGVFQDQALILAPILLEPIKLISTQTTSCAVQNAGGPVDGSTKSTWIWILDTGINLTHPDLNVQTNPAWAVSFIPGQTVEDGHGHGTHCAGIAAAKNNLFGVVGVSAGATVVPVKVLDNSGNGAFSGLLAGLNHVAGNDVPGDVVSMSLGGYGWSNCAAAYPPITAAIQGLGAAGTSVVMAAGNDGNCSGAGGTLPGCINGTRVYTVGAIACDKTCAPYSNWHPGIVDWAAVGSSVYSTYKGGTYQTLSGTSMATPVVAGIIHSKNGAPPANGGMVGCCGYSYPIAVR